MAVDFYLGLSGVPKGFFNAPYSGAYLAPHAANSPLDLSVWNAVPIPQRRV